MISWKQRVYAFLLRRLLGPYLTPDSLQKLHACLDVSLQEGTYVLKDVGLNAEYLSTKISGVRLRTVTIRKLEIRLSLEEHNTTTTGGTRTTTAAAEPAVLPSEQHDHEGPYDRNANVTSRTIDSSNSSSSLAWRAFQLGSNNSVSLVARIEVEGLLVDLEACPQNSRQQLRQERPSSHGASTAAADDEKTATAPPPSTKSYLSSYLDAALASLRLSIQLRDVRLRVYGTTSKRRPAGSSTENECWLETQVQSLSYRDAISEKAESIVSKNTDYRTALHKTVEWTRLTITAGTANGVTTATVGEVKDDSVKAEGTLTESNIQTIVLLDGTSRVTLRVIEYDLQRPQEKHAGVRTRNDIHVFLDQKLNVSVDVVTVSYVQSIVQSFLQQPAQESEASVASIGRSLAGPTFISGMDEEADYRTIDGIMKQYQEARILAERHLVRGGMLFPADDDENCDGVTFDTFFDANEHSMSRYSTVLKESIMGGRELSSDMGIPTDWIHTKFRFDLREGGVKLAFQPGEQQSRNSGREEYILLTFTDVCLASALRARSSEHSFSINYVELEDAMLVIADVDGDVDDGSGALQLVEIGSLMRFVSKDVGDDESDCDILVQSPCISLLVKNESIGTEDGQEAKTSTDVELTLEAIECSYRQRTISKLAHLVSALGPDAIDRSTVSGSASSGNQSGPLSMSLTLSLYIPSADISLPIMAKGAGWSKLYERCGYTTTSDAARKPALGVSFEEVVLNMQLESSLLRKREASLSCRHLVAYACSPKDKSVFGRKIQRLDLFALGGLTEAEPCIPITVKLSNSSDLTGTAATSLFPKAPLLSTFKARQQDEDEVDRIDGILSSKHCDVDVSSRKELREVDLQSMMLSDVAKSEIAISVYIPELVGDLSVSELLVLQSVFDSLNGDCSKKTVSNSGMPTTTDEHAIQLKRTAICLDLDFMSLAVHGNSEEGVSTTPSSFMTKMESFKAHSLTDGAYLRHLRVMAHELDFLEISNLSVPSMFQSVPCSMEARISLLHDRQMCHGDSVATPIVYRSHLFTPISRSSPAILVDLLNVDSGDKLLVQRNVYCTLYDTTYRLEYGAKWIQKMSSILRHEKSYHVDDLNARKEEDRQADEVHSLTRVFFSVADCNIDYSSCPRFKTASRAILRIGDFRLSSNIMSPCVSAQAFSISLGDISLYLCNNRYPYNFENSLLLRADTILRPHQYHLSIFQNAEPEAVQQVMNYRTVISVDSVDGIASISNRKTKKESVPDVCLSLTVGQVSLCACKDSFQILLQTIGQAAAELTALDDNALDALKLKSIELENHAAAAIENRADEKYDYLLRDLQQQRITRPAFVTSMNNDLHLDFLLDGYDWTTIDLECSAKPAIPEGEEYSAGWFPAGEVGFSDNNSVEQSEKGATSRTQIITDHFRYRPIADPLGEGDMGISKLIAPGAKYHVQTRVLVHNLSLRLRLFDGFDWPEQLSRKERELSQGNDFVIPEVPNENEDGEPTDATASVLVDSSCDSSDEKSKLMGDLLSGGIELGDTFRDVPLPEEKGKCLRDQAEFHRLARRAGKYFQITLSGVSVRLDSLEESKEHRLASCFSFKAQDFFVAETISSDRPVKMVGEWFNEDEHPRDSNDGLLMMKMISRHPSCRVTPENDIVNDENEVSLHILPLRCIVDQRAVAFVRAFFYAKQENEEEDGLPPGLHSIPPPLFSKLRVRPLKLKVDYHPQKLDTRALRDGAVVELVNLSPIDGMILTVKQVEVANEVGFGNALSIVVGGWVRHICATQLYKFVANMRPFEAITGVSGTAVDMVVLPWEAFQNGESIQKALRSGAKNFSKALVYEFLTITSRAAEFFAGNVSRASISQNLSTGITTPGGDLLPSRPLTIPRGLTDARPHAVESLSRGFQAANYKVVIVPFLEYQRTGATGAVKKVLRGIPVAITAPACGAAEALSFALLGARNSLRPDIRKEEEASLRGLHHLGDF